MARRSRVELNRQVLEAIEVAEADALFEVAQEVLAVVQVPDAPPYGTGLREGGGALAYASGKKVAGTAIGGRQIKKPRAFRTKVGEVAAIVGFGFPARFVELGTVDTPANPFLTRAVAFVVPEAEVIIGATIRKRLSGIRSFSGFSRKVA
jgi:hypothetical protein